MFDLERDSAIDASIMTLTALSVKAAPYQGALNLLFFRDAAIATPHFAPSGRRIFSKEKVTNSF